MVSDPELYELAARVAHKLRAAQRRVVTAESCTGGWVAKALTDVPGSSEWFECGYVTYSNAAKMRDLGVAGGTLERFGAVSEQAVREMAEGALRLAGGHGRPGCQRHRRTRWRHGREARGDRLVLCRRPPGRGD